MGAGMTSCGKIAHPFEEGTHVGIMFPNYIPSPPANRGSNTVNFPLFVSQGRRRSFKMWSRTWLASPLAVK